MNRNALPVKYPSISSFPCHAFYLSILENYDQCLSWLYSHYMQIRLDFKDNFTLTDYVVPHPEYHYNPFFYSYSQRLVRNHFENIGLDFIQNTKNLIDSGYYVYLPINEYYIPNTNAYNKNNFSHHMMVYGYNDHELAFDIAGFFNFDTPQKYAFSKVSYRQVSEGFSDCDVLHEYLNFIHLYKINPNGHCNLIPMFDSQFFIQSVEDYLNSCNSYPLLAVPFYNDTKIVFGHEVYNVIKNYTDIRAYFMIWEHKKFMLERIAFMYKNGIINNGEIIFNNYQEVEKKTKIISNMFLKYHMTKNIEILEKISKLLDLLVEEESIILKQLLSGFTRSAASNNLTANL